MSEKRDLSWLIKMTFLAILILARHAVSEVCDGVVAVYRRDNTLTEVPPLLMAVIVTWEN